VKLANTAEWRTIVVALDKDQGGIDYASDLP
jgi:hypothetical protein